MKIEFKKLEVEEEKGFIKKLYRSQHIRRTFFFIVAGAFAGFLFFYFTEGINDEVLVFRDALKSALIGGFFGFFITNSPCARGRC